MGKQNLCGDWICPWFRHGGDFYTMMSQLRHYGLAIGLTSLEVEAPALSYSVSIGTLS